MRRDTNAETSTPVVGGRYTYSGNGRTVTVREILSGNRCLVYWTTAGRKAAGQRYWLRQPENRTKIVRFSSLGFDGDRAP